ncbi:MAG: class I SAM-dependent methyltransferase [Candidatus Sumerlaeia bacterium]|nr:class I SAM-dependent methyltransferase [Candidatus Sumerlaeia bacterium]
MTDKQGDATPPGWWRDYFSSMYGHLYKGPMSVHLDTGNEISAICRLLPVREGIVLDLGCGHGRHLEPLLREGLQVIGLDWSADLLAMLSPESRRHACRGDMRQLPFADNSIAGVYLLFNTFGYFNDGENEEVLGEIARVLRPGGRLLMDLPSRPAMRDVIRSLPINERHYENATVTEHWDVSQDGKHIRSWGKWEAGGREQEWEMKMRLYTAHEVTRLLRQAGFSPAVEVRALEDLDQLGTSTPAPPLVGSQWRASTNLVVLAEKT